jgi:hypothetical protein
MISLGCSQLPHFKIFIPSIFEKCSIKIWDCTVERWEPLVSEGKASKGGEKIYSDDVYGKLSKTKECADWSIESEPLNPLVTLSQQPL